MAVETSVRRLWRTSALALKLRSLHQKTYISTTIVLTPRAGGKWMQLSPAALLARPAKDGEVGTSSKGEYKLPPCEKDSETYVMQDDVLKELEEFLVADVSDLACFYCTQPDVLGDPTCPVIEGGVCRFSIEALVDTINQLMARDMPNATPEEAREYIRAFLWSAPHL